MESKIQIWTKAHTIAALFLLVVGFWTLGVWSAVWTVRDAARQAETASPVNIAIQNASFEEPLAESGSSGWVPVPAWNATILLAGGGVHVVQDTGAPDGSHVVACLHCQISQDLGIRPQYGQNGTYFLSFYVANWFYAYPGEYTATLSIGAVPLCSAREWAIGAWTEVNLPCPFSNYLSVDGQMQHLGFVPADFLLSLSNPAGEYGWHVKFDKVSLKFLSQN